MALYGNMIGGAAPLKTVVITDEDGNEIVGVVTESVQMLDATPSDVKIGKTFVSDDGILEGTYTITYRTTHATYLVMPGADFSIPLSEYNQYDYTKFQAVISIFNTTEFDSLAVEKTVLYDGVYNANSNVKISDVVKNIDTKSVDLNIVNDTENVFIINYNTYKEE